MGDKVEVRRIDVDANPILAREMNISAIPIMQVYKGKALTWTGEGYMEKKLIVSQLK